MAERLQGFFYSETGTVWLVKIYDSSYVGATTDFQSEGIKINWTPEEQENRFSPILSSECRLRLVVNNSTLQTFVDDLVAAEEGRFTMALSNVVGLGNTIAWNGYIIPDLITIEDTQLAVGYTIEIRAKDGLNYLKNIDYNDADASWTGQYVWFEVECVPDVPGSSLVSQYTLVKVVDPDPVIDGYYMTIYTDTEYNAQTLPVSITLTPGDRLVASSASDQDIADAIGGCPSPGYSTTGSTRDEAYTPQPEVFGIGTEEPVSAVSFMVYLLKVLNQLPGISTLYTTSQTVLNVVCNWYETQRTYDSTENPLAITRLPRRLFYYRDVKGNVVHKTCYDVVAEICRAWGARMVFSGTAYWFVQLNEYRSPTSKNIWRYTRTGAETLATAQDLTIFHDPASGSNEVVRFSGGNFQFYPAYRTVTVDYEHVASRNLIAGKTWDTLEAAATVEDVSSNGGVATLSFSGVMKYNGTALTPPFVPFFIRMKIRLQVGTYYFTNENGPNEWVGYAADYYFSVYVATIGTIYTAGISFVTPALQEDGDLSMDFTQDDLLYSDGTSAVGEMFALWDMENNYLELLQSGTFEGQAYVNRYSTSNNGTASEKLTVKTIIGDGPTLTSPGHIEIQNDLSEWVMAETWKVGNSGTAKAFSQLLSNEIHSGQVTPVKRFGQAAMRSNDPDNNPLAPHIVLSYDSAYWIFHNGQYDIGTEIVTGSWWKTQSSNAYTENANEFLPANSADGPPTSSGPSGTGGGSGGGGGGAGGGGSSPSFAHHQRFANHSSATLTVTVNGGQIPTNTAQYAIFQNGQFVSPSFFSVSGSAITLTFTPSAKNIDVIFWYP